MSLMWYRKECCHYPDSVWRSPESLQVRWLGARVCRWTEEDSDRSVVHPCSQYTGILSEPSVRESRRWLTTRVERFTDIMNEIHSYVQWNLWIRDTVGTSKVSHFQRCQQIVYKISWALEKCDSAYWQKTDYVLKFFLSSLPFPVQTEWCFDDVCMWESVRCRNKSLSPLCCILHTGSWGERERGRGGERERERRERGRGRWKSWKRWSINISDSLSTDHYHHSIQLSMHHYLNH